MLIEPNGSVRIHSAMESDAQQFLASTDTIGGDKGTSPSSRLRILIVEDETILAMQVEDMIEKLGHVVVGSVASHAQTITRAQASRPDLAVMDINLGHGGNGIEAALELRQRFNMPSVFVSAYLSSASDREWAQTARPLGLVPKPYTARHIEAVLRQAAGRIAPSRN